MRNSPTSAQRVLLAALAVLAALSAPSAWPSARWEVYVNNQQLIGRVLREGRETLVEAEPAAAALKARYTFNPATRTASVNGIPLPTRVAGGRVLVSLRALAAAVRAKVEDHPELALVDVITFDPTRRALALEQRPEPTPRFGRPTIGDNPKEIITPAAMDLIYDQCHGYLAAYLGMDITATVDRHFTTLANLQSQLNTTREAAKHVYGFTQWTLQNTTCELWVPYGLPRDQVTHIMCHEMSHVWQRQEDVQFGTSVLIEGFCEWTAYSMMQYLGYADEMKRIENNKALAYSQGFFYIKNMAERIGAMATIAHFRHSRTDLLRQN